MPLLFTSYDISDIDDVDAIVNIEIPDQEKMDELQDQLYMAAGSEALLGARNTIGEIAPGQVAVTTAFDLPMKYIIHTVGPDQNQEKQKALDVLTSCYSNSLKKASELECESVALPFYKSYGTDLTKDDVIQAAIDVCEQFLIDSDMDIYYMLADHPQNETLKYNSYEFSRLLNSIGHLTWSATGSINTKNVTDSMDGSESIWVDHSVKKTKESNYSGIELNAKNFRERIDKEIQSPGKFSIYLSDLIDKKGLKSSDVWRGANMNSQTFSKITNELLDYHTTKNNVIALALSMKLGLDEMEELLMLEGYALSPYDDSDVCVKLYVESGHYDVTRLNILRYDLGMPQLGQTKPRKQKKDLLEGFW